MPHEKVFKELAKLREKEDNKYNFVTKSETEFKAEKGYGEELIHKISDMKKEPDWMKEIRIKAFKVFQEKPLPDWGPDLSKIDFSEISYFIKPKAKNTKDWNDVPKEIKETFDKLGVPEAEQKYLAGSVAQYESDAVYHNIKKQWEDKGVLFMDMDTALQKHPEIIKEYFMKAVPITDNKFSALHASVWSGGSFLYVPKGVEIDLPLQTYFRMNSEKQGQFEHTLIIAEEGSRVHYIEGCFTKGTEIKTETETKKIEEIKKGEKVLTHKGNFKEVYFTQKRPYTGKLYEINICGNTIQKLEATEEHPFLIAKREKANERNAQFETKWVEAKNIRKGDYVCYPINKKITENEFYEFEISKGNSKGQFIKIKEKVKANRDFFKLAGYFLSEGSVSKGFYTSISFNVKENNYVSETKKLFRNVFGIEKFYEPVHKINNGISIVVSSAKITRIFEYFGKSSEKKEIPEWMLFEKPEKQAELIKGLFNGDGNYGKKKYVWGTKEMFRINTISKKLALQTREILLRLGIASSINKQKRKSPRKTMYVIVIGGEYLKKFGELVGIKAGENLNNKKRATMFSIDKDYFYAPIKSIKKTKVKNLDVFNFGVEKDESYTANGLAVHNCTAPKFSDYSLHSAVVEIYVKDNAKVRYTTIQNWSKNVYNLNTKRALVGKNAKMEWVGGSLGSFITMLYPCSVLTGEGASADHLNIAFGADKTWKDGGAKVIHNAPNTSSKILAKSISMRGGKGVYRGLVRINKGAKNAKSHVSCDALILDKQGSVSDTYPHNEINESTATFTHEATVNKINEEQIFYLRSRGLKEEEARSLIVLGFLNEVAKEIPLEFAVEFSRLVNLEMSKLPKVG